MANNRLISWVRDERYAWALGVLVVFLATRLLVLAAGYMGDLALTEPLGGGYWWPNRDNLFQDIWARWDSGFYTSIAHSGYTFEGSQAESLAFFPLYPLLIAFFEPLFGSALLSGIVVSNVSLLGAMLFLYLLTDLEFGDRDTAMRAVLVMVLFPTAFFLSAVYTESTFLLFVIGSIYFARRRLWAWAALMGVLASATRSTGIMMWGVVGLEWMRANGWTFDRIHTQAAWRALGRALRVDFLTVLVICLIPLGLGSYILLQHDYADSPLKFMEVQENWGRGERGPLEALNEDLKQIRLPALRRGEVSSQVLINFVFFWPPFFLVPFIWRRMGASYGLYSLLTLTIPVSTGITMSISRYALVMFPMFMLLAHWMRHRWVATAVLVTFSIFLGILFTIFANWVFVA